MRTRRVLTKVATKFQNTLQNQVRKKNHIYTRTDKKYQIVYKYCRNFSFLNLLKLVLKLLPKFTRSQDLAEEAQNFNTLILDYVLSLRSFKCTNCENYINTRIKLFVHNDSHLWVLFLFSKISFCFSCRSYFSILYFFLVFGFSLE